MEECGTGGAPGNPIKDILIFEKHMLAYYDGETRRRFVYFLVFLSLLFTFAVRGMKYAEQILWVPGEVQDLEKLQGFMVRLYLKMLGTVFLLAYLFLRMFRKSSKLTRVLSAQLQLLNVRFEDRRISLSKIKAPAKIKQALALFRAEEEKRRKHFQKNE